MSRTAVPARVGKAYASVSAGDWDEEDCEAIAAEESMKISRMIIASAGIAIGGIILAFALSNARPHRQNAAASAHIRHAPMGKDSLGSHFAQLSEAGLTGPGAAEEEACKQTLPNSDKTSEDEPEPAYAEAKPGHRVRMPPFQGLEYQLFLPAAWRPSGVKLWPVVVFLHGAGDGKFSVMNSQSLPRLLVRDQSTSFDPRQCWCLDPEFANVTAKQEAPANSDSAFIDRDEDLRSPLADCDFADTFGAIVVMPQGWLPNHMTGWTQEKLLKVEELTRSVLRTYRGDPQRVSLTGQSAGGHGAWVFAASRPHLWSAVSIVCYPMPNPDFAAKLEEVPIWVAGWTEDGERGNDQSVELLKKRTSGTVRYTRYIEAPAPPDPKYNFMLGHASYDLIYRDPRLWNWTLSLVNDHGREHWQLGSL